MPIRNEASYIEKSLHSVVAQDYPSERIQVLVSDGRSDDNTREIVNEIICKHPRYDIQLLDNPGRIVPTGFNDALARATGVVIVRVDGHCEISGDYLKCCIESLRETGAACVGGPLETVGDTVTAEAIALAQSSPFGVGGVVFRTEAAKSNGQYVDTLAFGAYRREVFTSLGGYDEELVRNQDDEFNFRLIQAGGRIWLSPSLRSVYYSRSRLPDLWRQYYGYGLYKVRVIQKRGAVPSWRHVVPALFIIGLLASLFMALVTGEPLWALSIFGPYALSNLVASVNAAKGEWRTLLVLPIVFAILHLSYGSGFISGLWRWRTGWGEKTPTGKLLPRWPGM